MNSIFEIAINQAKDNSLNYFLETREKFVGVLAKEKNTLNEGKWKPFFAVNPKYNLENILIGMTEWNSFEGFGKTSAKLMPQEVTQNYFSSFDPLTYAILEKIDGKSFNLNSIKIEGQVVEFAIRKGKTDDAFGAKRDKFFNSLESYDGFKFAREFKVYELNEQGVTSLTENTQAVIIVWGSVDKFQTAAQSIFASEEYNNFSSVIDVQSYFATSPTNKIKHL